MFTNSNVERTSFASLLSQEFSCWLKVCHATVWQVKIDIVGFPGNVYTQGLSGTHSVSVGKNNVLRSMRCEICSICNAAHGDAAVCGTASERRRYNVTWSLIGWANSQIGPLRGRALGYEACSLWSKRIWSSAIGKKKWRTIWCNTLSYPIW